MNWECLGPGHWRWGEYDARRITRNTWELRRHGNALYTSLSSLNDCKLTARRHADSLVPINVESYPIAGVTRVEVIDHRPTALLRGRAFTAHQVERAELSFQDENRTLKVFLT